MVRLVSVEAIQIIRSIRPVI